MVQKVGYGDFAFNDFWGMNGYNGSVNIIGQYNMAAIGVESTFMDGCWIYHVSVC